MTPQGFNPRSGSPAEPRRDAVKKLPRDWRDLGDAACCAALFVAAITGLLALYWVLWYMPPLR
ncbi:hypothetical protein [Ramlibacter sp. WS9]|uniref:hypothetical protein n=1 Tax=Ramlibacter sp. WS9 TaxID=1882741 RepID=UPI001141B70B|nr:hypothetical protein [Ramlibacter sp. WS9]ROZ75074.1 hypothetical protein EEB15_17015 [Ramlibacter sp. WS9]